MKTTIQKTSADGIEVFEKYFVNWKHAANFCRWASRNDGSEYKVLAFDGVPKQPTVEK